MEQNSEKLPALSELAGRVDKTSNGLAIWHRPWTANGRIQAMYIISTEQAQIIFDVSAQTLMNWLKNGMNNAQVAYGWWDYQRLVQWVIYIKDHPSRKENNLFRRKK